MTTRNTRLYIHISRHSRPSRSTDKNGIAEDRTSPRLQLCPSAGTTLDCITVLQSQLPNDLVGIAQATMLRAISADKFGLFHSYFVYAQLDHNTYTVIAVRRHRLVIIVPAHVSQVSLPSFPERLDSPCTRNIGCVFGQILGNPEHHERAVFSIKTRNNRTILHNSINQGVTSRRKLRRGCLFVPREGI